MEEDDNREGSGVRVCGNEEAKPEVELQKKNVWFVFMCVGACYKVEEGMNLFFFFFKFWWLRVEVVVGGGGCDCRCGRCW